MKFYFALSPVAANAGKFEAVEAESKLEAMEKANVKFARNIPNFYAWFESGGKNRFYATTGAWD